ncbi:hypothetical protein WA026_009994 [Henosepilachna vigintioctopunctata]|uniref:Glucose-methanol-choline oxidoreductase N-terminal domain-containing protein n=1 Tax=Henosepilachna vigintioctopunctata TaxID=420089 RepID=A0AAW1TTG9_9CUCU
MKGYLVLSLYLFYSVQCNSDLKIEYYEKLIKQGIADSLSYKMRTDNRDFFGDGVDEGDLIDFGEFDFIIVGGGSSGSVVTNRLSEIKEWKILLLEAGEEEDDFSEIPGMHLFLTPSSRNWGYKTTSQKNGCMGMLNNECLYARGKILGGSGAINGLVYIRGHKEDYDNWEALGNPGWAYKDILKYFKRAENSELENGEEEYHGFGGSINNAYSKPDSIFHQVFVDALSERGLNEVDYNGAEQIGVGKFQNSIKFGKRSSGGNSYILSARNRRNLKISLGSYVTKILLDDVSRKAYGVEFMKNGQKYRAIASNEVILAGGSINTPHLLMLSGIGPKEELMKHNIKLFQDLPVGQYMRDHVAFTNVYFRTNHSESTIALRKMVEDYLQGKGILTTSYGSKSVAFLNINDAKAKKPNVEIVMLPPTGNSDNLKLSRNFKKEASAAVHSVDMKHDIALAAIILNPKSNGRLSLKSNTSRDFPLIDVGLFSSREDLQAMYEAVKFAVDLQKTEAFKRFNATPYLDLKPCSQHSFNTKKFWYCAIQHLSFNSYHISSTAKMGMITDPQAVVDNKLKVYGVKNLRVVDCSMMPDTISGHTNAVAFMIGEKASDMIKEEYLEYVSQ